MADKIKDYYDYANTQVNEQAIIDKFNQATLAGFAQQRAQNEQTENKFYNQMYNTQRTAMDTIRNANAAAVATGASRGVQAAQELSALLGLQQESVASATEIAQARQQTAQEETAAVLENVLQAYQQAATERAQIVQQQIEQASVNAQQDANAVATIQAQAQADANRQSHILGLAQAYEQARANGNTAGMQAYAAELAKYGVTPPTTGGGGSTVTSKYRDNTGNITTSYYDATDPVAPFGFTSADLNDQNTDNIYKVLNQAGFDSNARNIYDIAKDANDEIKQDGFKNGKIKGKAAAYISTIKSDAENRQIPVGAIVQLNYGEYSGGKNHTYMYLGGTSFAKVALNKHSINVHGDTYTINGRPIYVPEGYRLDRATKQGAKASGIEIKYD